MANALDTTVRKVRRTRRIPKTARCADCGIDTPVVLQRDGKQWRCYECATIRRGERADETHHILGKDVDPTTTDIPGNLHRFLSEEQLAMPEAIRTANPRNPLVIVIRFLCAVRDLGTAFLDFLTRGINWLARLLERLEEKFGADWAAKLDLPPLFG